MPRTRGTSSSTAAAGALLLAVVLASSPKPVAASAIDQAYAGLIAVACTSIVFAALGLAVGWQWPQPHCLCFNVAFLDMTGGSRHCCSLYRINAAYVAGWTVLSCIAIVTRVVPRIALCLGVNVLHLAVVLYLRSRFIKHGYPLWHSDSNAHTLAAQAGSGDYALQPPPVQPEMRRSARQAAASDGQVLGHAVYDIPLYTAWIDGPLPSMAPAKAALASAPADRATAQHADWEPGSSTAQHSTPWRRASGPLGGDAGGQVPVPTPSGPAPHPLQLGTGGAASYSSSRHNGSSWLRSPAAVVPSDEEAATENHVEGQPVIGAPVATLQAGGAAGAGPSSSLAVDPASGRSAMPALGTPVPSGTQVVEGVPVAEFHAQRRYGRMPTSPSLPSSQSNSIQQNTAEQQQQQGSISSDGVVPAAAVTARPPSTRQWGSRAARSAAAPASPSTASLPISENGMLLSPSRHRPRPVLAASATALEASPRARATSAAAAGSNGGGDRRYDAGHGGSGALAAPPIAASAGADPQQAQRAGAGVAQPAAAGERISRTTAILGRGNHASDTGSTELPSPSTIAVVARHARSAGS